MLAVKSRLQCNG